MTNNKVETPSFGGNVHDLLSSLEAIQDDKSDLETLDPYGNPFEGKSPVEMVEQFFNMHPGIDNLEILEQRLGDFLAGEKNDQMPEVYQQVSDKIQELKLASQTK
jgi:hypothetical protein